MFAWFHRHLHWSARIRVRVADVGPEATALRRLIRAWLPEAPDVRPALQLGRVEIVVLHHVRAFGDAGPVAPALTDRAGAVTRVCLGRFRPAPGPAWEPYTPAELLTALEVHLEALARGYARPALWWPGVEALATSAVAPASVAPALAPARPAARRPRAHRWRRLASGPAAATTPPSAEPSGDTPPGEPDPTPAAPADVTVREPASDAPSGDPGRWPTDGASPAE